MQAFSSIMTINAFFSRLRERSRLVNRLPSQFLPIPPRATPHQIFSPTGFFISMAKLIFGCGYLGLRVAQRWLAKRETVVAVTRSATKAEQFAALGLLPLVADITTSDLPHRIAQISEIDTVFFAVGYDRTANKSIHEVYVDGLQRVLSALPEGIRRFIYISSTGVYGSAEGEVVDENSPCLPTRAGGQACLAAEQRLLQSRFADRTTILRLAGIYGPGRIPRAARSAAGKPIPAPSQGWLNLIHVDDAAQIVLLAENHAPPPQRFCVSDGEPTLRSEYYAELARLLHAPPPRFTEPPSDSPAAQSPAAQSPAAQSPAAQSPAALRATSDKRVSNELMMQVLRPRLQFPSYREGLAAIVKGFP